MYAFIFVKNEGMMRGMIVQDVRERRVEIVSTKREREIYRKTLREVGTVGNEMVLRDIIIVQVDIYVRERRVEIVLQKREIYRKTLRLREVGMVGNEVVLRDIVVVLVDIHVREKRRRIVRMVNEVVLGEIV